MPADAAAPAALAGDEGLGDGRPAADPVAVAQALNGAWNAGQVERVVALFAADAVVQQVGTELTPYQGTTAATASDVYGTTRSFPDARFPEREGAVVWAAGTAEIRAWVSDLVARHHGVEATGYRQVGPDGARARWAYRVFVAPYRDFRDVPPTEGTAEVRVRDGAITTLTLASSAESVRRRERALLDVAAARFAGRSAPARRDPGTQAVGPWAVAGGRPAAAEGPMWGLPLALAAALGGLVRAQRHRARSNNRCSPGAPAGPGRSVIRWTLRPAGRSGRPPQASGGWRPR